MILRINKKLILEKIEEASKFYYGEIDGEIIPLKNTIYPGAIQQHENWKKEYNRKKNDEIIRRASLKQSKFPTYSPEYKALEKSIEKYKAK